MVDKRFFTRSSLVLLKDICSKGSISDLIINQDILESDIRIESVSPLKHAQSDQLSFFSNPKYRDDCNASKAGVIITKPQFEKDVPQDSRALISHDPYRLYALIAEQLYDVMNAQDPLLSYHQDDYGAYIHQDAILEKDVITAPGVVIHKNAHIGQGTSIKAGTIIGQGCMIGRDCKLSSNISISFSLIGDRVNIASNSVIGDSGFGFAMGKTHQSVPQLGRVIIQDDVHIGSLTAIDRGAIEDTIIGEGCRIDNLVQIAHNVLLGMHCVIAGKTAIAGSVIFEDYVVCGGHTCIAGHITMGAGSQIAGGSAVMRSIPKGEIWSGTPAKPKKQNFKELAMLSRLTRKGVK